MVKKMLLKHIGQYQDLTVKRLLEHTDFSAYDKDSPLMLRKIIQKLFSILKFSNKYWHRKKYKKYSH